MTPPSRSVVIHGHFYQPPREDPWLEVVEREASAAPWHDWNQRIEQECYRAVVAARVPAADRHILDIVNVLRYEDLHDVILVGISGGGMAITGAAERVPERIGHLVYLDAFVPQDGQSIGDLLGPQVQWPGCHLRWIQDRGSRDH